MKWTHLTGCGGTRVYALTSNDRAHAVVSWDGEWRVWIPGERRHLQGEFPTLRTAKTAAENYVSKFVRGTNGGYRSARAGR